MQTATKAPKRPRSPGQPLSSKNGSFAAAAVAAVIAGLLIMVFLQQYRNGVNNDGVPTPVLVAQQLIEQGASGDTVGAQGLFKSVKVPRDQLKTGAVTDAAALQGKIAAADILPGQQITAADFKRAGHGVVTKLAADERAMTVSLDNAHGLVGKIARGDRVDVLAGFMLDSAIGRPRPVLRLLMQNVLVLDVPAKVAPGVIGGGTNQTAEITLRVASAAAPKLAFAADNGKIWLTLRPQNGERLDDDGLVSLSSLLADAKPISAGRKSP